MPCGLERSVRFTQRNNQMSYQLNGRYYTDFNEYQRARQEYEARQSSEQAESLRAANRDLQNRIAAGQRELESSRGDMQRQMRINQQIQLDVQEIERNVSRAEEAQRNFEAQTAQRFGEMESEIGENRVDLQQLRREHEAHVQRVRAGFEAVRSEISQGLAVAEQRRRETEIRLQTAIKAVDDKVEQDRQARIQREKSQLAQAAACIQIAEEVVAANAGVLQRLSLREEAERIRHTTAQAGRHAAEGMSEVAFSVASMALTEARQLESSIRSRQATLEARRLSLLQDVKFLRGALNSPDLAVFFPKEVANVGLKLDYLENRANRVYENYAPLEVEGDKDQQAIGRLRSAVTDIVSSTPVLRAKAEERRERAAVLVESVEDEYGPAANVDFHYAVEGDPKSTLVATFDFNGPKVVLHIELDGSFRQDGFNHADNSDCTRMAHAVAHSFGRRVVVTGSQTEATNRTTESADASRTSARQVEAERIAEKLKEM
jgi:hypothetical protein